MPNEQPQPSVTESSNRIDPRGARASLHLALAAGGMGAWEHDLDTGALRWSREASRALGIRTDDYGGTFEGFLGLIHPEDVERVAPPTPARSWSPPVTGSSFAYARATAKWRGSTSRRGCWRMPPADRLGW